MNQSRWWECLVPENIHTQRTEVFLVCTPPPPSSGDFSLGSYFPLKILAFKSPLLLRISNDPPWWGFGYFLEPQWKCHKTKLKGPLDKKLALYVYYTFWFFSVMCPSAKQQQWNQQILGFTENEKSQQIFVLYLNVNAVAMNLPRG